jgi:hypothetical protein
MQKYVVLARNVTSLRIQTLLAMSQHELAASCRVDLRTGTIFPQHQWQQVLQTVS